MGSLKSFLCVKKMKWFESYLSKLGIFSYKTGMSGISNIPPKFTSKNEEYKTTFKVTHTFQLSDQGFTSVSKSEKFKVVKWC